MPTGFDVPFRLTAKYFEMEFVSLLIFKLKGDEINNPIIQIRAATLNDVPGIARVHVDVWNSTYTGIVPQEFLDSRTYENKTPQWQRIVGEAKPRSHVYVAVTETDEVVGFTSGGVNRDETYKFDSELYAIYLLKNHHSKGIGRRLFELTINLLVADGFKNMLVWVLEENATREFYKKMGGTACGEKIEDIGGKPLRELAFGWNPISPNNENINTKELVPNLLPL